MSRGIWDVCEVRGENKVDAPRSERVWSRRARHLVQTVCSVFLKLAAQSGFPHVVYAHGNGDLLSTQVFAIACANEYSVDGG